MAVVAVATLGACIPNKHTITYDAQANRFTDVPTYVEVGDSLTLLVKGLTYAERYGGTTDTTRLTEVLHPAEAGGLALKPLAANVPTPEQPPNHFLPATVIELPSVRTGNTDLGNVAAEIENTASGMTATQKAAALRRLLEAAHAVRANYADKLRKDSAACEGDLRALASYISGHPAQAAYLVFMQDPEAARLAASAATDPVYDTTAALAKRLERGWTPAPADTAVFRKVLAQALDLQQRLRLMWLHLGAPPSAAAPTDSLRRYVDDAGACDAAGRPDRLAMDEAGVAFVALKLPGPRPPALAPLPSVPLSNRYRDVGGAHLLALAARSDDDLEWLHAFGRNLVLIESQATRAAATLNTFPAYLKLPGPDTVPIGTFDHPVNVKVAIKRVPRFGQVVITPVVSTAPNGASGGLALVDTLHGPDLQALPVARVPVFQPYRFRFTIGGAFSQLNALTYDTAGGRLRVTGTARSRFFPVAVLSTAVLPLRGQVLADQARELDWQKSKWNGFWRGLGLWVQTGLSVADPTKNGFIGVATEPVRGLMIGFGGHFGYVQLPNDIPVDSVVPAGTPATRHAWRRGYAWTATVDGSVILDSFGALLGIK